MSGQPQHVSGWFLADSAGSPMPPITNPPVDPGFGQPTPPGKPSLPIQLPPLPPGWGDAKPPQLPPPSVGGGPIVPDWPVVIPQPPEKPQPGPPNVPGQPLPQPPDVPGGGPVPPDKPSLPPGTIWPPLDPSGGIGGTGKYLVLVHVFGVDKSRWLIYDAGAHATPPIAPAPPTSGPK